MTDPGSTPSTSDATTTATPPDDWPVQAADAIERAVGTVRDKTTGPALTVARAVVYGLFSLFAGAAVLVMLVIAGVRLLDAYLPSAWFGETHTWAAHLVLGALLCLAGAVMWRQRKAPDAR